MSSVVSTCFWAAACLQYEQRYEKRAHWVHVLNDLRRPTAARAHSVRALGLEIKQCVSLLRCNNRARARFLVDAKKEVKHRPPFICRRSSIAAAAATRSSSSSVVYVARTNCERVRSSHRDVTSSSDARLCSSTSAVPRRRRRGGGDDDEL